MSLLDTIESATETAGQWIDSSYEWLAEKADKAGFPGASEFLRSAGDFIASSTGGSVDELELGQTCDPKELVRGEPATIAQTAQTLTTLAEQLDSTCTALSSIDTGAWIGDAATSFTNTFTQQRQLWADAADAMTDTAEKLTFWRRTVEAAQAKAAHAIVLWERAETARLNAAANDAAFTDTWTAQYRQAREILSDARAARNEAASTVASAIAKATSEAPTEPAFADQMLANLADATLIAEHGQLSAGKGLVNSLTGIVQFARQVNPTDPYNVTHLAQYVAGLSDKAAGLSQTLADPGAAASAAWTNVRKSPFEAAGSLLGEAAIAAGTGGAGVAGSLGRAGIKGLDGDSTPDGEKAGPDQESETKSDPSPGEPAEFQRFEATEFRNEVRSLDHFERHAADFGATTEAEYVRLAARFLEEAQANAYPTKFGKGGRIRVFDPETNRFGVYYPDGTIATFYKPILADYWETNAPEYGVDVIWVD